MQIVERAAQEFSSRREVRIADGRHHEIYREYPLNGVASLDAEQPDEALHKQTGEHEANRAEADLTAHQQAAHAAARRASGRGPRIGLQRVLWIGKRKFPSRQKAEHQARNHGNQERKPEHRRIQTHFIYARKIRRSMGHNQPDYGLRKQHSRHAAQRRKDQAFRQHLLAEPSAGRADRRPDSQFPPRRVARQ